MPAPQLKAYVNGQTAPVTSDNLNSFQQTCDTIPQLRGFIGLPGVQVYVRGTAVPNDGGQGAFYWDSSGTGPDNGTSIIVPTGAATGAWIRVSSDGVNNSGLGYINVLSYGATGSGTVDDSTAINSAFAGVPANGGTVYFPAGNYLCKSQLTASKPLRIVGSGPSRQSGSPAATMITKASSMTTTLFPITADMTIIDDIAFFGQAGNTGDGLAIVADFVVLNNVSAIGMGQDGIRGGRDVGSFGANCCKLNNVLASSNGRYGLNLDDNVVPAASNVNAWSIVGGYYNQNGSDGVRIGHALLNSFTNCTSEGNTGYALRNTYGKYTTIFGGDWQEDANNIILDVTSTKTTILGANCGTITDNTTDNSTTNIQQGQVNSITSFNKLSLFIGAADFFSNINVGGAIASAGAWVTVKSPDVGGYAQDFIGRTADGQSVLRFLSPNVGTVYGSIGANNAGAFSFATPGGANLQLLASGSATLGLPSLATNATAGFPYIPSCAGTPSGVPTAVTGYSPIVFDTSGNKIWVYNGAWKGVAVS